MSTTEVGITRIGQIQIRAGDVERAANFYENVLGLKLLFKASPGLAFFDCGGVRLMLERPAKAEFDHASSILYFAFPTYTSHARLREKGVRFEDALTLSWHDRHRPLDCAREQGACFLCLAYKGRSLTAKCVEDFRRERRERLSARVGTDYTPIGADVARTLLAYGTAASPPRRPKAAVPTRPDARIMIPCLPGRHGRSDNPGRICLGAKR
jgi:catechol 2,3-dioxygenase-like lactoylglutathione lyase family enzyme